MIKNLIVKVSQHLEKLMYYPSCNEKIIKKRKILSLAGLWGFGLVLPFILFLQVFQIKLIYSVLTATFATLVPSVKTPSADFSAIDLKEFFSVIGILAISAWALYFVIAFLNKRQKLDELEAIKQKAPNEKIIKNKSGSEKVNFQTKHYLPVLFIFENPEDISISRTALLNSKNYFVIDGIENNCLKKVFEIIPSITANNTMMQKIVDIDMHEKLKTEFMNNSNPVVMFTIKTASYLQLAGSETWLDIRIPALRTEDAFAMKIKAILEKNLDNDTFNMNDLCSELAISHAQLYRKFKSISNISIYEYFKILRLNRARELLTKTELNVTQAAFAAGFKNLSYFSREFTHRFGKNPKNIQKSSHPNIV